MTGKYLDFSGPRELMPLGGDPFPDFMDYEPDLTEQIRYECDDKINDVIKSLPIAAESDVEVSHQVNTDRTVRLLWAMATRKLKSAKELILIIGFSYIWWGLNQLLTHLVSLTWIDILNQRSRDELSAIRPKQSLITFVYSFRFLYRFRAKRSIFWNFWHLRNIRSLYWPIII